MIRRTLIVVLTILALSRPGICQVTRSAPDTLKRMHGIPVPVPDVDTIRQIWRPALSMQNALRIAEAYLEKEHESALTRENIDVRRYYLRGAELGRYGSENGGKLVWYFIWKHEEVDHPSPITIIVSMEGEPFWVPQM